MSRSFVMDTTPPAFAGIQELATNPGNIVVMSLTVDFTEPIDPTGSDWQDVTLTRDGGPNLITADVLVEPVDADTFRISNFNWVSGLDGTYELTA